MSGQLDGKAALVTGASSGNGRAIALRFAEEGADVTVADIQTDPRMGGEPTTELIEEMGQDVQFVECDVSDEAAIRAAVEAHVDAFGSLDVMVNNAGVERQLPIEDVEVDDYEFIMNINLRGVYFGCQAAVEAMLDQDEGGSIVNMSSIAGLVGVDNSSLYCTSKGGVTNLTRQLAGEHGPNGIRVNAINPGIIETAMTVKDGDTMGPIVEQTPLRRAGRPAEVADAALFLASEQSSYVTGHNLVIDGGFTA